MQLCKLYVNVDDGHAVSEGEACHDGFLEMTNQVFGRRALSLLFPTLALRSHLLHGLHSCLGGSSLFGSRVGALLDLGQPLHQSLRELRMGRVSREVRYKSCPQRTTS